MNIELGFYDKLHQEWLKINEKTPLHQLFDLTQTFTVDVLGFEKCVIFVHDDLTGLFRVHNFRGFQPADAKKLKFIQLLLSGEIIETLRLEKSHLDHTESSPEYLVEKLLNSLSFSEASLELFGGDVDIPFGLIIVGNSQTNPQHDFKNHTALRHLISKLSSAVNNIIFYQAWEKEKLTLEDNIKLKTQQLRTEKENFEAIYKTSKDGIAILDIHTTAFLEANPAYLDMTGMTKPELLRTSCMALTKPEDIERSQQVLKEVIEKGFYKDFIKTCIVKNKADIVVNMSLVLMSDHQRILVTSKDVTQKMELETALINANNEIKKRNLELKAFGENQEQLVHQRTQELEIALQKSQAATKAKSNFLATMSHEIRTPMNGVIGMTNLLMETPLNDEQKQYVNVLKGTSRALMALINDILDFSKIEAGKLNLEIIPVNLKEVFQELFDSFESQSKNKSIDLEINLPDEIPSRVLLDPTRLRQILFNLTSNALKFTESGTVTISLSQLHDKDTFQVTVTDTGIGMTPSEMDKLFNIFTQADDSTTRKYGGTGLGLVICQKLTELMSGKIWVDSVKDQGSSFHFTFKAPLAISEQPKHTESTRNLDLSHVKLLLVEDNPINRLLASKLLQKLGINPDIAEDGLEAIKAVKKIPYDILLMDIQMPNMDGLTATKQIRKLEAIKQPYIIALTANAFSEDKTACMSAGMNEFLSKPINFEKLKETLRIAPI